MKKTLLLFFLGFSLTALCQDSYALSSDSKLTIAGTSTAHSWVVSANQIEGSLTQKGVAPISIDITVQVAEIKSERGPTMDKKMHAALKKEVHPEISFVLQEIQNTSTLLGTLEIAGIKKEVEINAEISSEENTLIIEGEKKIILQDYEIKPPSAMFGQIIVGDEVTVKFNLIFDRF